MSRKNKKNEFYKNSKQNVEKKQSPSEVDTVAIYGRSSPIPSPEEMEKYKAIDPDFPRIIINQWVEQTKHRQEMEKKVIKSDTGNSRLGVVLGFILGMSVITAGVVLVMHGHSIEGTIFSGSGLAALIGVFIYGTQSRKKERTEKYEKSKQIENINNNK